MSLSQYLSTEALLQSSAYVRRMAETGMSVPAYAYAANNPLHYVDRDGLRISANVTNDPHGWIPGCTPAPHGGLTCAQVGRVGNVGACRQSPNGCGYGFDVHVDSYIATHYSPSADPRRQSLGDPVGFSLENHEFGHRLDLEKALGEFSLNQSIQTEGFGSPGECTKARDSFDSSLADYYRTSQLDSVMQRDRY